MHLRSKLIFIIGLLTASIYGQKGFEIGGWLGTSVYYGDLNTSLIPKKPGLAGGFCGRRNFNTRVALKTSLSLARIAGSDALSSNNFEKARNLSFRSTIFDWTNSIEFNFFEYEHGSKDAYFTPYLMAGFSFFSYNPKAKLDNTWHELRPLGTEVQDLGGEYGRINGGLTIGGGFKWDYNRDISFNIEFSTRRLFTDYIDDVSTVYTDSKSIKARRGEIAEALADRSLQEGIGVIGRQRGNSRDNDTYFLFGFGVMRYFGGIECPKISEIRD
jgi:hypothetical protein